jgi:hypothetical protein
MARKCKKGKKEKGNKEEEIIALSGSRRQLNPVESQDRFPYGNESMKITADQRKS